MAEFSPDMLSAGQPAPEDFAAAAKRGVKTVINLRSSREMASLPWNEKTVVEDLGMTYIHLPVNGLAGITVDNARLLNETVDNAAAPVLLHCKSSNRVGALVALIAGKIDGKSPKEALIAGRVAGLTSAEPHVAGILRRP